MDERSDVKLNMESKIWLLLERIMKCLKMQVCQVLLKCKGAEPCFLIWDGLGLLKVKGFSFSHSY